MFGANDFGVKASSGDEGGYLNPFANILSSLQPFVANLYDEVHVALLGVELLDEIPSSLDGATCGKEVIVQQHHIIGVDGIQMDFDGVFSIFLSEALPDGGGWEFAGLACHHETCI